ncbi:MAG: 2-oxoacid:acceptor oxidoreductase family protein [Chloroflexi bacterium]|nr:2-oxoacid:acceptor oxidoreductase family protein [Chloroflexota bacterium]
MKNTVKELCQAPAGQAEVLQGNMAFATGCVRGGVHAVDGYPGTPSTEVIDRGLSQVQDLIKVGWSINEAVAAAVGHGHSLAGRDCVVTMKIPGLFQAGDIFTSGALFVQPRGALVYYIASDFTPSSTQHTLDPRYLFKSCFVPVFEPRNHQEMHESAALAVKISRTYKTQVVVMPNGNLCHSEGLVHLMPAEQHEPVHMPESLKSFNVLPAIARKNYDTVLAERMPALLEMVEKSPLNKWEKSAHTGVTKKAKIGVITYGIGDLYVREVKETLGAEFDLLSLAFTNPLPMQLIRNFCQSIDGEIYVIEDGYRYLQETIENAGFKVSGKEAFSSLTEWTPALVAEKMGLATHQQTNAAAPVYRPPVICPGCPYRLIAQEISLLKKKKVLDTVFGDIGCNTLLYFMNALDTGLAMGASESERLGYVFSRPEQAGRCISVVGDGTECHSGMDATRNTVYRNMPGVKVILDNSWAGMTGGQPSPTSPKNLAGESMRFNLTESLKAHGANVVSVGAYEKKNLRQTLKTALAEAEKGVYTTLVVSDGVCVQMVPASTQRVLVEPDACKKCNACLVCPGLELDASGIPVVNNLCSGCGGSTPACAQMCPTNVLKAVDLRDLNLPALPKFAEPSQDDSLPVISKTELPARLSLAIRGVGGQGNLFFGSVMSKLAFLAGYADRNIIKGETHGMAQMGGPVISTFSCGNVSSPVLLPGTADCLIVMEKSEVLRPGFLEMLKPGGTIILADTKIVPPDLPEDQYPSDEQINSSLEGYNVVEVDVLSKALELGDRSGRTANVVMMGILSTLPPFNLIPSELWLRSLKNANSKPTVWAANYIAFHTGSQIIQVAEATI